MVGFSQASDLQAWSNLQSYYDSTGKTLLVRDLFQKDPGEPRETNMDEHT